MNRVNPWPDGTELPPNLTYTARELLITEAEGYVELAEFPYGLMFNRTKKPMQDSTPRLFVFPPPYHPVEVMMANRGWGGTWGGQFALDAFMAISDWRKTSFDLAIPEAVKVLGVEEATVRWLYDIFTGSRNSFSQRLIRRQLGFSPEAMR